MTDYDFDEPAPTPRLTREEAAAKAAQMRTAAEAAKALTDARRAAIPVIPTPTPVETPEEAETAAEFVAEPEAPPPVALATAVAPLPAPVDPFPTRFKKIVKPPVTEVSKAMQSATKTLMDLTAKLGHVLARQAEIAAETKSLSYGAHTGDDDARRRLDALDEEDSKLSREAGSLRVAVEIGERNVTAETERAVDAVEVEQARQALAMVDAFALRGQELDSKVKALVDGYNGLVEDFRQLRGVGFAPASHEAAASAMRRALETALMPTDLKITHLAPYLRLDFNSAISGWAANVRARATRRISLSKVAA